MAMSAGVSGGVKATPNVTPMIDVMLVLLIIFMLVIPAITAGFQAIPPMGTNLKPHPESDSKRGARPAVKRDFREPHRG
ncbi:MAG: hypothetical protein DMD63_01530 [Gemmatimonadetes bacterium]|nr:MAG: hypothetical protein DMD63_01530 [Gemmatimonadota bacterium]